MNTNRETTILSLSRYTRQVFAIAFIFSASFYAITKSVSTKQAFNALTNELIPDGAEVETGTLIRYVITVDGAAAGTRVRVNDQFPVAGCVLPYNATTSAPVAATTSVSLSLSNAAPNSVVDLFYTSTGVNETLTIEAVVKCPNCNGAPIPFTNTANIQFTGVGQLPFPTHSIILVNPNPQVTISGREQICKGKEICLCADVANNPDNKPLSYEWTKCSDPATIISTDRCFTKRRAKLSDSDAYIVKVTKCNGCFAQAQKSICVTPCVPQCTPAPECNTPS